jgi:DNA processing protein
MELYWLWLSNLKYVGPVIQKELLKRFKNPKAIYEASDEELEKVPSMNSRALQSILSNKTIEAAERIMNDVYKKNINLLCYGDPLYPAKVLHCPESPAVLYYKGNLKLLSNSVAVIGSRRCTGYGKKTALEIGRELANKDIPLISGFAKGVDSYAQTSCLQQGGYTLGFLASGVDICYPKEQRVLYEKMLERGSIFISQYPPGTQPNYKYFLQRNALIAAWSNEVIIVEATEKSGALWTAQFSKKYGRGVYAVPNQLGIAEGVGTNNLIAEGLAQPYLGIQSLQSIKSKKYTELKDIFNNTHEMLNPHINNPLLSFLKDSPKTIIEITHHLQESEQKILEHLLNLELEGKVTIRGNLVTSK